MKAWIVFLGILLTMPGAAAAKKKEKKDKKAAAEVNVVQLASDKASGGDVDGAIELLRAASADGTATGDVYLKLGELLSGKADLDAAIDALTAAADKLAESARAEALGRLSLVQAARGVGDAAASAEAAVSADAEGVWPQIALSHLRARQGQGDLAVTLAEKAATAGGGAAAQNALGFAQEARADMAAAETAYRQALADAPNHIGANVGLARVLRKTSRATEAEPILQKVIDAAPGAVEAYKESAYVKLALNRPEDAMADASLAAVLAEGDPEAKALTRKVTVAKALMYIKNNESELAIQDLTAFCEQNPDSVEGHIGLARAQIAQNQIEAAGASLQKAVALDAANAEAHFYLGHIEHAHKRNANGALSAYEQAVSLEPGNDEYRINLGAVLSELGQNDRAVTELTRVVEGSGAQRADAWIYLGGAHLNAKRYKDAVAALEKGLALAPEVPLGNAYIAWAYLGLKDAANFKKYGAKARALGYKDKDFLSRLTGVERGEPIR
ncbi:MAG: tetratricopeptide repeat protein [Vicinamibacteria bacterium]|nr:tetratricopeptide repeat protein [Vicinamibacteria bacterium]